RALPLPEALAIVQRDSGKAFDPQVVEVLTRRYVDLERMARERVAQTADRTKLSTDVKVERGAAPAAGFEETANAATDLLNMHKSVQATAAGPAMEVLMERMKSCETQIEAFAALRDAVLAVMPYQALVLYCRKGEALTPAFLDGSGQSEF